MPNTEIFSSTGIYPIPAMSYPATRVAHTPSVDKASVCMGGTYCCLTLNKLYPPKTAALPSTLGIYNNATIPVANSINPQWSQFTQSGVYNIWPGLTFQILGHRTEQ